MMVRCPNYDEATCHLVCKHRGLHEEHSNCGHEITYCHEADVEIRCQLTKDCDHES